MTKIPSLQKKENQNIFKLKIKWNCNVDFCLFILITEHVSSDEAKSFFEENYSHIFYILYETFVQAETNLKQRGK